MSLRLRIILLASACILPSVLLLASSQWQLRQARKAEVEREIVELARSEATEIDTIIGGARQFLTALQRTPAIVDRNGAFCSAWLARLRRDFPAYASIRADDVGGRAFCSSNPGRAAFDGESRFFQTALETRTLVAGAYGLSPLSRSPELPLAHVIADDDGTARGVLVVGLDLHWLAQDLARRLPPDAALTVLDGSGQAILDVAGDGLPAQPGATAGDGLVTAHATTGLGLQVIAARPKSSVFAALDRTTMDGAALIVVALLVASLAAALLAQRFIRAPIGRLLTVTDRLRRGDLAARSDVMGRSELAQLGAGLNGMAEELESRQRAQADAEQRLRRLAATLEQRVADRTRDLAEANQMLSTEAEQRHRVQVELAQAQKLDALGKLTGGVAHDFNNLLAAVLGSLELAASHVAEPRVRRLLAVAEQAARRGAKLTAQMLAFSRKQDLVLRPVEVNAVIAGMDELLSGAAGKLIQFHYDLTEDLCPAMADPVQLEVALLNLAINARDAMPAGGSLTFRTRNTRMPHGPHAGVTLPPGDYAMVSVIDTGEGMPPEVQAKAFEPFFTTKETGKGTGLGLSMIYGFVRQAGGTVTIDSTPGKGTAVSLYLPRATAAAAIEDTAPAEAAAVPPMSVLLVDDDSFVRETISETLHELGHSVVEAADGAAALALLQDAVAFDIALVDFAMPKMTGAQLADALLALRPGLPVVLVTGYADAEVLQGWSGQGRRTLRKPFGRAELMRALRDAIAASDDGLRGR
jgi:signal transduction histidine kinase/ActR/RegA family two-component response regulator